MPKILYKVTFEVTGLKEDDCEAIVDDIKTEIELMGYNVNVGILHEDADLTGETL